MIPPFSFARIPQIIFGAGKLNELYNIIPKFGNNVLFVIGGRSLQQSGIWDEITSNLEGKSINFSSTSISSEPSPLLIDETVTKFRDKDLNLVIGIGGGSVTDAGKAISAMLTKNDSIKNYLEGVGDKIHDGKKIPYIAIPTTSGTGSEATKNAVISEVGPEGFKKSLRHDNLIPNITIVDPQLMISCPASISAACGMDAFTQLLEAYVSSKANPITDTLAYNGMKYMSKNILLACSTGSSDVNVRAAMAYGSLISGITLANAGLGIVHGLASPIGGMFKIPHGVVCGTLLSAATKINIEMLQNQGPEGRKGLKKHAQIGALLTSKYHVEEGMIDQYCSKLIETLEIWTNELKIDRLGKYGIKNEDVEKIVEKAGLKNNPVSLSKENIKTIVTNRL
ncbi:MAG: iron-containing alcohol dehydrogenase [Candidatus Lokiarchaeota archaeon]|nr:iron-containing alcohol dehydrogenase [Candidatus Lokiarchaeota archaeon]